MKILVQSDDFGFTKGVIAGMADAFENGIITSTGLFANMPCCDEAIEVMKRYPNICFGIDINVTSGPSVADKELLPTLINPATNQFFQTSERQKDPRWMKEDIFKPYDEVYIEACAQVEKFIKKLGKKPEYLTSHSTSGSKTYLKAIRDVARKYDIPFSKDIYEKYGFKLLFDFTEGDPYSYENQIKDEVSRMLNLLEQNKNEEYVVLPSHCGFVDSDLMKYSRCNIDRIFDHEMLTSEKIKKWIRDNNAQLISYRDLV